MAYRKFNLGLGTALFAVCTGLALAACGSDDDEGMTALEKLTMTLGGQEALDGLAGLEVMASGGRFIPNEGFAPDSEIAAANTFERTVSFDLENDLLRVDTTRERLFLFTGEEQYSDILRGDLGASTQTFLGGPSDEENAPAPISSDKVAAIQLQEKLLNPHVLFASLAEAGFVEGEDENLNGELHHRLMAVGSSPELTFYVHAETGTLSKVATSEGDYFSRDVDLEIMYSGWQTTSEEIGYPSTVQLVRNGDVLLEQEVLGFSVNPSFSADLFAFPENVEPVLDEALFARGGEVHQWYFLLDSIGLPFAGIDTAITAVDAAPGVQQLRGGSHHSFVVEQADGLVLVDAPLHDDRGTALVSYLATEYPGKPIQFVVSSHFHEDHAAGIREVLGATEATLVVHESVEAFWSELLARPSALRPDALESNPREVSIQVVPDNGSLALEDAEHTVTLFDMNSGHADDLLLAHEASSNSVFVVDIYSPGNQDQFGAAELNATIVDNAIPTEELQILGGHGAEIHSYADLEGFLTAE